jgi:hypothetical protein
MGDADLSGDWIGIYNYPALHGPVRFQAMISDADGWLSGTTSEEDAAIRPGANLTATIEGRREGMTVTFVKIYDDLSVNPDIIRYSGTIQPGGDEISGEWEMPGIWSGTFLMMRESGVEEAIEQDVGEEIRA